MRNKFTWANFTTEFLNSVLTSSKAPKRVRLIEPIDDKEFLVERMRLLTKMPFENFILRFRDEIEKYILPEQEELVSAFKDIDGRTYFGSAWNQKTEMIDVLRKKGYTSILIGAYINILFKIGTKTEFSNVVSLFREPITIALKKEGTKGDVCLFDYQQDAVDKLHKFYLEDNGKSGFLVMPTGSGKTRTAVYFLIKHMISAGYQVIWLSHRYMLIDQTASSFYTMAPLAKESTVKRDALQMICVSGEHSHISATLRNDDILILGVQSTIRGLEYLEHKLTDRVVIVVDEAHHTAAPSYMEIIRQIRKIRPNAKLLGLTATPMRTNDEDHAKLMKIFENRMIYQIPMSNLIAKEILAKPTFESVQTDYEIEPTKEDMRYFGKYQELSPSLLRRIGSAKKRNDLIVQVYKKGQKRYGKTLIFATDIIHAQTLNEELKAHRISSEVVYCGQSNNQGRIKRFRDGEVDVLININILTEGSDVPEIQTVFLTRPTLSDILLIQMIGRGMRGPAVGGTEELNIVDFIDKRGDFAKWLNPEYVLGGEPITTIRPQKVVRGNIQEILWKKIFDVYSGNNSGETRFSGPEITLPYGWFDLGKDLEENDVVLIFEDQIAGYEKLEKDVSNIASKTKVSTNQIIARYWNDFSYPINDIDLEKVIAYVRENASFPKIITFEMRDSIDPVVLARKFSDAKVDEIKQEAKLVYDTYHENIDKVFGNLNRYISKILMFMSKSNTRVEEMEPSKKDYDPNPIYEEEGLRKLTRQVIESMEMEEIGTDIDITWSSKAHTSYFGVCKESNGHKSIVINRMLDSKSISEEFVKYVIYHELIHYAGNWSHNREFMNRWHEYYDYVNLEAYMRRELPDYEVDYDQY